MIQSTETTDRLQTHTHPHHTLSLPTHTYNLTYIHHPRFYTDTGPTLPTESATTNQQLLYVCTYVHALSSVQCITHSRYIGIYRDTYIEWPLISMDSPPAAVWGYLCTLISTDRSQPKIHQECMRGPHGRGILGRCPWSIEELRLAYAKQTLGLAEATPVLNHMTQGECTNEPCHSTIHEPREGNLPTTLQ